MSTTLLQAFRSLKVTPELQAIGKQVDEFVARVGKTPFTNIADRIAKTDFRTTTTLNVPEIGKTLQVNKPFDLLRELESQPGSLHSPRLRQAVGNSIAALRKSLEDESPKTFLKNLSFKLENVPSEEELLDPTKFKKREINWEWFQKKGLSAEEVSKLQAKIQEHQSEDKLIASQQKLDEEIHAVAKKFDGVVQDVLNGWLFQTGNVSKLIERSSKKEEALRFYLTATTEQILEKHPEWQEKINQDIMESKWAAFEDPADPQWEAKKNFVPRLPRDVAKEHAAHGHH